MPASDTVTRADDDATGGMPTISSVRELAELIERHGQQLFIRWSRGPQVDADTTSRDELTGAELPGLCANPMAVERWWGDRALLLWAARRVYDYRHLQTDADPDVRPWLLVGEELGRGPDNEPLVEMRRPVAWLSDEAVAEAERLVTEADRTGDWGPLKRGG